MFNTSFSLDDQCHSQPRLSALLTCGNNIMPLSWHMPVSKSPFRYAVAVREENHSHTLLKKNRKFALNFLDVSYQHAFQLSGEVHGKDIDKFDLCRLTPKKAMTIDTDLIQEAYMIYECTVVDIISYGDHDLFIADVNVILNKEKDDIDPTLFLGRGYYDTLSDKPMRMEKNPNE